jgi:hypothetical protein
MTNPVPFSAAQRATLISCGAVQSLGLGISITDHGKVPEMAVLYRQDPNVVLWKLHASDHGIIVLTGTSGIWALRSMEAALEAVTKMERTRAF